MGKLILFTVTACLIMNAILLCVDIVCWFGEGVVCAVSCWMWILFYFVPGLKEVIVLSLFAWHWILFHFMTYESGFYKSLLTRGTECCLCRWIWKPCLKISAIVEECLKKVTLCCHWLHSWEYYIFKCDRMPESDFGKWLCAVIGCIVENVIFKCGKKQ